MNVLTTITHTLLFDEYIIEVLYLEYTGNGTCYQYRITKGDMLVQSDVEYSQREEAAAGAFLWLAAND